MKHLIFLMATSLFVPVLFAQTTVSGTLFDTINKQPLQHSSIVLLHAKDSVMYRFARSNGQGAFSFSKADTGTYILLITHPTYADYVDQLKVTGTNLDLGVVPMTLAANILQEVIVKQQVAAMRMRGDTVEYTADSFQVRQGASVEEMLRKLPGIQVDKDGKITAQGEQVQKVLVDGEEFFGDDPTLATKNIQADAIDKVQVFDKKSDQATFTGIDDGEKTKTLNLTLKQDKKKGYFGKIDLASNFNNRWNNSAMINNFKGKTKLSAYGIFSNTGKTGLDWNEQGKYGSNNNVEYNDDFGGFMIFGSDDEFSNGSFNGEGLPKSWSAGLNGSEKWNADKQNLNGSYRYNKLNSEGSSSTVAQSRLPGDAFFINRESADMFSSRDRHSVNGLYEWQIDSTTSTKITGSGYTGTSSNYNGYLSSATNAAGNLVNSSRRITTFTGNNDNLNVNAIFRKKFKKLGRSFSLNVNEEYNASDANGFLKNTTSYFDSKDGGFLRDSVTNQMKINNSKVNTLSAKAVFTEPLAKKLFLETNYAIRNNTSTSQQLSYDSTTDGKYESLNAIYSNDYRFDVFTHTTGTALRYNGKKVTASAGTDIGFTHFYQKDVIADTDYTRTYTNFFPKANLTMKFSGNTRFNINYNGSTRQPSITQLQPVKNNSNPLIEFVGNPALRQSFSHRISASFSQYNVFKQRGFWFWSSFNTTNNDVVTSQVTDTATGKTTLQYINTNGNYNYYGNFNLNGKWKKLDLNVNGGFDFNGTKYSNVVNGVANVTTNNAPSFNIGLSKYKEKKYSIWINSQLIYNMSKSSVQKEFSTNYWTMQHQLNLNVSLPFRLEMNTDVSYNYRQKTDLFFTNNNVFLWNAYVGRKLLKDDKAMLKITGNDLLNQNKGFRRDISTNTITERNYQTLRRYFMIAFTWNFSKNPGGTPSPSN